MRPILLQGHTRPLTQIKYNREGDLLFTVAKDKVASVWYSHNGERVGTYNGHLGSIYTIDVNDNSTICITGSGDNTAKLWEVRTGKCLFTWTEETAVKRVQFSEDNKMVLFVTEQRMGFPGGIKIYSIDENLSSEQNPEPISVINNSSDTTKKFTVAAWTANDKNLAVGHLDGSLSIIDWKNGEVLCSSHPHSEQIMDIQMSSDKSYFITASKDKDAKLIETNTLSLLKNYSTDTPLNSASITPVTDFVVVGGGQEAMNVTTTSARQGKFECRFYHKIYAEEIGRLKGHFGPINTIAVEPTGKGFASGGEDGYVRLQQFDPEYFKFKM
ncbi:translation initiation factor eIF3 subunit [Entomophthora muscae]|uniref:Translation initiation factor eIF3 subunit n=1 Tax=Entomophthora muscae TaxID=34485 RepID=A0ACC2TD37_9FUNG|nr:translation initiation factor eIF3 subunit [Entomophthora muscae]